MRVKHDTMDDRIGSRLSSSMQWYVHVQGRQHASGSWVESSNGR
jgi:hypothetical protein